MNDRAITFTQNELNAIAIVIWCEIENNKKRLQDNNFSYADDKASCQEFLKQLESAQNKINKGVNNNE